MAFKFKRDNGYYYVIYKEGRRTVWLSLATKDETEAQRKFEELRPSLERLKPTTLQELTDAILQYSAVNHQKGTTDLYTVAFQHLLECLGDKPLKFVMPMDGERFKEFLLNK